MDKLMTIQLLYYRDGRFLFGSARPTPPLLANGADSDEVARVYRSDAVRRSNLMPPTIPI